VAFEYSKPERRHVIIFIGGLMDGLNTVPYVPKLAAALPPSFSLVQTLITSSYSGWGHSSLQRDVDELSLCVAYFRNILPSGSNIILMGHSTGCQDSLFYLTGPGCESRQPIEGAILQAPVSDREAIEMFLPDTSRQAGLETAQEMQKAGKELEIMPSNLTSAFFPIPVTAYRWLSLLSPNHDGDDDLFSSDLEPEKLQQTFGSIPTRTKLCVLVGENDQYVPRFIDREALVRKWMNVANRDRVVIDPQTSGVLLGANHNVSNNPTAETELVTRVKMFIEQFVQD